MPDEIETLFGEVQNIVRLAGPWPHGLRRALEFARDNPGLLGDQAFWDRVAAHDFRDCLAGR